MNDTETIIKYLKLYNEWRRGDEKMGQPNPIEIGKLIDEACEKLASLERERDEWGALVGQYKSERDDARKQVLELKAYGVEDDQTIDRLIRERDEARAWAEKLQTVAMEHSIRAENAERERDDAREERDAALLVIKGLKE